MRPILVGVVLAAMLLGACGGQGPSTQPAASTGGSALATTPSASANRVSTPPATSTPNPADIQLLALGDSIPFNLQDDCPGCTGYVDLYGRAIEEATGQTVAVLNMSKHTGLTSAGLLEDLTTGGGLLGIIAEAEAVTVSIGYNDAPMNLDDDPCDGAAGDFPALATYTDACIDEWADAFAERFDEILSKIDDARSGQPTLLTVVNIYDWWLGYADNPDDVDENIAVVRNVLERQNADICRIAAEHHALCADLHTAFNGPKHDQPSGALLARDYSHPSQLGNDLIAETLAELGFAPLN